MQHTYTGKAFRQVTPPRSVPDPGLTVKSLAAITTNLLTIATKTTTAILRPD